MVKVTVNHVMSNDVKSKIFDDIMAYFKRYAEGFVYQVSEKPLAGAVIRHYHRPNLESELVNPAIVTVHHDLAESDDWLSFDSYEKQYRQADLIICLNEDQRSFLKRAGIENTVVVPHGYNDKYLSLARRDFDGERKLTLGMFSRRYPRKVKGEAYFIELAQHLDPDHFKFLLIGQDRKLDARHLRQLGFEVRCYDGVPYPVLCQAYHSIDLLLIASRHEGGPANVPEALATSTPMATTPVGMARDFVKHGVNGFFLAQDAAKDAAALEDLFCHPQRMLELFEGARLASNAARPWSAVVARHEEIYRGLMNELLGVAHG
jgi:glycosyltransferase involved in cell wall biosynthesis